MEKQQVLLMCYLCTTMFFSVWSMLKDGKNNEVVQSSQHLKHGLQDSTNDIFFVGYQAKGTPGRRMIEKQIPVKAGIHTLTGYSAHADQNTLINWVRSMPQPPKEIRLVHGEDHARHALAEKLCHCELAFGQRGNLS